MSYLKLVLKILKNEPYLLPPIVVIVIIAIIAAMAGNPIVAPFLYTIF